MISECVAVTNWNGASWSNSSNEIINVLKLNVVLHRCLACCKVVAPCTVDDPCYVEHPALRMIYVVLNALHCGWSMLCWAPSTVDVPCCVERPALWMIHVVLSAQHCGWSMLCWAPCTVDVPCCVVCPALWMLHAVLCALNCGCSMLCWWVLVPHARVLRGDVHELRFDYIFFIKIKTIEEIFLLHEKCMINYLKISTFYLIIFYIYIWVLPFNIPHGNVIRVPLLAKMLMYTWIWSVNLEVVQYLLMIMNLL